MIYAYLRVSTVLQDEQNQRAGIDAKAKSLGLKIDKYIIDKISGTTEPAKRNLGKLLRRVKPGDTIIVSELSRFGRRLFMLFRILEALLGKEVTVYSVKDAFVLDATLQSKVMAFAFGIAAEIERDMIAMRTKEALAIRKQMGIKLGRPVGAATKVHKLDPFKDKILRWHKKGMPIAKIARKMHCVDKTVRKYLRLWGVDTSIKVKVSKKPKPSQPLTIPVQNSTGTTQEKPKVYALPAVISVCKSLSLPSSTLINMS